jgi:hypothetical protein
MLAMVVQEYSKEAVGSGAWAENDLYVRELGWLHFLATKIIRYEVAKVGNLTHIVTPAKFPPRGKPKTDLDRPRLAA